MPRGQARRPEGGAPRLLESAHWLEPEQQPIEGLVLSAPWARPSDAGVQHGLAAERGERALRRVAYKVPDHRLSHWVALFIADRVDVIESFPLDLFKRLKRRVARAGKFRRPASQRAMTEAPEVGVAVRGS